MDTNSVSFKIYSSARPQSPSSSSQSEVAIFEHWHVERLLQDKRTGSVTSFGSNSFPDHGSAHTLVLENVTPNYVLGRVRNELQHLEFLSGDISERVLAQSQRADLPQGQPLLYIVLVKLTRKEYMEKEETCAICLDDLETKHMCLFPGCFHQFHEDCLSEWIDRRGHASCPLCRASCPTSCRLIRASTLV